MFSFKHVEVFMPSEIQLTFGRKKWALRSVILNTAKMLGREGVLLNFVLPGKVFAGFWYLWY